MGIFERLTIFRSRWVFGVLVLGFGFAVLGYSLRSSQGPVYQATARLLIGGYLQDTRPTSSDIDVANDLARTYAQLAMTSVLREDAIRASDLRVADGSLMTLKQLDLAVKVSIGTDIPFIDIVASAHNPQLAADIANGVAEQVVLRSPVMPQDSDEVAPIQNQINVLTAQLENNNNLLAELDRRAQDFNELAARQSLRTERQLLTDNTIQISNTLSDLENTLATLRNPTNTIDIVEPARIPVEDTATHPLIVAGLGFIVGTMLGSGLLLLTDEMFPRLSTPQRVKSLNGLPILGQLPSIQLPPKPSSRWLVTHKQPLSASANAYQSLYTRLPRPVRPETAIYIVGSVRRAEGKSITAANLAVMMASAGYKVLIVDANLRRPVLHSIFEVDESMGGLSRLLEASLDELVNLTGDEITKFFKKYIQDSSIPNVYVLPRGKLDDDLKTASLLLRLPHIEQWLAPLHEHYGIDVFIFDTAASTASSEALLLAQALDGHTVLVMETHQTPRSEAQETIDQLNRTRARLAGAVLNKQ